MKPEFAAFWQARHLCTVTVLRPDGSPHVTPMGIVLDERRATAWGITSGQSRKAAHVRAAGADGARVAVCQVDGRWWSTLEGRARVLEDTASVREAERRYAERYRVPRANPDRVALRIDVDRWLGSVRP